MPPRSAAYFRVRDGCFDMIHPRSGLLLRDRHANGLAGRKVKHGRGRWFLMGGSAWPCA
jgi:hypothetical protein